MPLWKCNVDGLNGSVGHFRMQYVGAG